MSLRLASALCALAVISVAPAANARRTRPGSATPKLVSPDAGGRAPAPVPEVSGAGAASASGAGSGTGSGSGSSISETIGDLWSRVRAQVLGWHAALSKHMPGEAAWAALASPLWLLLLIIIVRRARAKRRRRRAPAFAGANKAVRGGAAAAPAAGSSGAASVADEPQRPPRARKQTYVDPAREIPAPQRVLLSATSDVSSFYRTLICAGAEPDVFAALTASARACFDHAGWAAAVADGTPAHLARLRRDWAARIAVERAVSWLREHPRLDGLDVQVPAQLDDPELPGLDITRPDGLGAQLDEEQREALDTARGAAGDVIADLENPASLLSAALRWRTAGRSPLLPAPSADAAGNKIAIEPARIFRSWLLLEGLSAWRRAPELGLKMPRNVELDQALDEHFRLVGTAVAAEGPALHALSALSGGKLPGCGTVLASVAGAAYSTSSVVMRISKLAGELPAEVARATSTLGVRVSAALADTSSEDGAPLARNVLRLLGVELLEETRARLPRIEALFDKKKAAPLWTGAPLEPLRPDQALFELYRDQLASQLERARGAAERLHEILAALDYAGKSGQDRAIANRRLGYAVVALGVPLLRGTSTELLSAAREALSLAESA